MVVEGIVDRSAHAVLSGRTRSAAGYLPPPFGMLAAPAQSWVIADGWHL
jgi:hypothetical protein